MNSSLRGCIFSLTIVTVAPLSLATGATAQDFTYGERLFVENCAVCHGSGAEGGGEVATLFNVPLPNLRTLSERNGGAFPFSEVYQTISGSRDVQAHGVKMPVWGSVFREEAVTRTMHPGVDAEGLVQGRILGLVYYLQSIQK